MKVEKLGDSLAVKLPESIVNLLGLKEGDEVNVSVAKRAPAAERDPKKVEEAMKAIRRARWKFPPGFKFDREELYDR